MGTVPCAGFVQCILKPARIRSASPLKAEVFDLQGCHLQFDQGPVRGVDPGEVHQNQIVSILLVAADALIVSDEVDPRLVYELVCKTPAGLGDVVPQLSPQ